jgi:CheY-like chemotaxis protein
MWPRTARRYRLSAPSSTLGHHSRSAYRSTTLPPGHLNRGVGSGPALLPNEGDVTRDRTDLQGWYREAMLRRADELRGMRDRLEAGHKAVFDEARKVGMSLRGSGATFGFPEVTAVAALLETASDRDVLRRVEGVIGALQSLGVGVDDLAPSPPEWLTRAAGVELGPAAPPGASDFVGGRDQGAVWDRVARASGFDHAELADRVAQHFGIEVAALGERRRSAQRLVPEALAVRGRLVPLREDLLTITVATADPTSLSVELELERLTGRRPVFTVAPPAAIDAVLSDLFSGSDRPAPPEALPAARARSSKVTSDAVPGTVLVVDDEPSARLLVRALLERRGYPVAEAEDGVVALDVIRADESVGLVIADLNMPRMDGLELIWELRDVYDREHLPVIVVTGEVDEILETQLMEEGADDYIRKPIDPRLFLARVESTLRRAGSR